MSDSSSPAGGELPPTPDAAATEPAAATDAEAASASGPEQPKANSKLRWVLIVVGAVVAWQLWDWRGNVSAPGKPVDAPVTLITADRDDLACAMEKTVGKYRCEFPAPGKTWPEPPASAQKLMPYFTTDRQMYLIPGMWEQESVALRYKNEPPQGQPRDKLKRFVAHCRLHLVQKVEGFQTRWQSGGNWGNGDPAWVAEIVGCQAADQ
jgi:hypothetical protein